MDGLLRDVPRIRRQPKLLPITICIDKPVKMNGQILNAINVRNLFSTNAVVSGFTPDCDRRTLLA
jgi:hypothetical protein